MDNDRLLYYIKVFIITLVVIFAMYFVRLIVDNNYIVFIINIFILLGQCVILRGLSNEYLNKCKEKK